MNKRKVALGPGAASLILIVVILSLCMLAMLTMIGSKNDYSLGVRSAEMIQKVYELNESSEKRLAELDAVLVDCLKKETDPEAYLKLVGNNLPAEMELDEDLVTWYSPLDNRTLECIVQILPPGEKNRTKWVSHKLVVEEPEDDWEW